MNKLIIRNSFSDRQQLIKFGQTSSTFCNMKLGVPQGSVLGPLFFLLFINDLAFYVRSFECKLFADDTTLYLSNKNLDCLLEKFNEAIAPLIDWCKFNRLDINWSKTFFMFITNKRVSLPSTISLKNLNCDVKVVDSFKLLGVEIDNKLSFQKYVANVKLTVLRKMYSIKRLFYLATSVKIQFFKTFILPYFDYCISLFIYFPKPAIQSLCNCFNLCLFKLFNFNSKNESVNFYNNFLEKYNLFTLQHRIVYRIFCFSYNLFNNKCSPTGLTSKIIPSEKTKYDFRKKASCAEPALKNHYGENTFRFFFSKLLNNFISKDDLLLKFNFFKTRTFNNINIIFDNFKLIFSKFDILNTMFVFK